MKKEKPQTGMVEFLKGMEKDMGKFNAGVIKFILHNCTEYDGKCVEIIMRVHSMCPKEKK